MVERAEKIYEKLLDLGLSEEDINSQVSEKLTEYHGFMTKDVRYQYGILTRKGYIYGLIAI